MIKKTIQNRNLITLIIKYKRHVSFQEAFHNMSVSMLTIFSRLYHYVLAICSLFSCPRFAFLCLRNHVLIALFSHVARTPQPMYTIFLLSSLLRTSPKKNLHFQWLPVVASLNHVACIFDHVAASVVCVGTHNIATSSYYYLPLLTAYPQPIK